MSNETDLDWLARNVHVWPAGGHQDWCYVGHGYHDTHIVAQGSAIGLNPVGRKRIDKCQWLARRAELQNKPSWESAQAQADFMAQEPHGVWTFFATQPFNPSQVNNDGWRFDGGFQAWSSDMRGEVLGDWRDTLERRPVDLSEPAVTERLQGAVDNVLAAVPELKSDSFKFEPLTSIEDNQEQSIRQGNGWFERGELPPVGVECEYTLGTGAPWYQCEIKYVIRDDGVVMKRIPCGSEQYCGLHHKHPVSFRPIRTERDKAIDEMAKAVGLHVSVFEVEAGKLYDAGYRKEQK